MELIIHNFMCYSDFRVTFNPGEVTLITGPSEIGKSSLFYAIEWALYGKVQKVYRGETQKVSVTLRLPEITIYRQARPGSLVVDYRGHQTKGSAAQKVIDHYFHSKEVWKASSVVEQKRRCFLLECNYKDRLKLLSSLLFDQDDPEYYQNKVEEYRDKVKEKHDRFLSNYEAELRQFSRESFSTTCSPIQIEEEISQTNSEIEKRKNELGEIEREQIRLRERLKIEEEKKEKKKRLEGRLGTLQQELASLDVHQSPETLREKINRITEELNNLKSNQARYQSYRKIKDQIKELKPLSPEFLTSEYYHQVQKEEEIRKEAIQTLQSYRIKYQSEEIDQRKKELQKKIDYHRKTYPLVSKARQMVRVQEELTRYPENYSWRSEDLSQLEKRIEEIKRGLRLLQCPQCRQGLFYHQGKLIISDSKPETREELTRVEKELTRAKKEFHNHQKKEKLLQEKVQLEQDFSDRDKVSEIARYRPIALDRVYRELVSLEKIQVIPPPPVSLKTLQEHHRQLELKKKLKEFPSELSPPPETSELKKKIAQFRDQLKKAEKKKQLEEELSRLKNSLSEIQTNPKIEDKWSQGEQRLSHLHREVEEESSQLVRLREDLKLTIEKERVTRYQEKLSHTISLLDRLVKLRFEMIENLIEDINQNADPVLKKIFDKSVIIQLQLSKKLKTKDLTRNMVNLEIFFDGKKHEKKLCGGENDRISLALLLALNQVSRSPFLLIDELLGTVSSRIAGKCIQQIQKYSRGKYVISIEHNAVQGRYDRVIKLGR